MVQLRSVVRTNNFAKSALCSQIVLCDSSRKWLFRLKGTLAEVGFTFARFFYVLQWSHGPQSVWKVRIVTPSGVEGRQFNPIWGDCFPPQKIRWASAVNLLAKTFHTVCAGQAGEGFIPRPLRAWNAPFDGGWMAMGQNWDNIGTPGYGKMAIGRCKDEYYPLKKFVPVISRFYF